MQSLETLTMEHALIGRGLGALEIVARREEEGRGVPENTVVRLLSFFETFGDRYHHIKEEHVLIPQLEDRCKSRSRCHEGRVIGEVFYEHEVGRRMLASLERVAGLLQNEEDRGVFTHMAAEYEALLRNQMAKEKDYLLRAASKKLHASDGRLVRSFRDYAQREEVQTTAREFASEIDAILADLSVAVPRPTRRAYSRGTIPYHRGRNSGKIVF
jgi:hemerythrin-like domain-containing protein